MQKKWTPLLVVLITILVLTGCARPPLESASRSGTSTAAALEFDRVKGSPVELRMFLQRFPKGGDLHNHLSGTIYAEDYIEWALADDRCIDPQSLKLFLPPCSEAADRPALAQALARGTVDRNRLLDAWSMRNFLPGPTAASGHEQFFRTFSLFSAATEGRAGDMLVEAIDQAVTQRIGYLELMLSLQRGAAADLGRRIVSPGDWGLLTEALLEAGIAELVPPAMRQLDEMEDRVRQHYGCPAADTPACAVEVRYLAQVTRTMAPTQLFAQSLLAFLLIEADPRVVGLNLVAPEDDPSALATYETQMEQLRFFADRFGPVPISLHAGELTLGLVHPRHLRSHIRQAVEIAGARRIGHGVAIAYEQDAEQLLLDMARKQVAVEINLTSNEQILGVQGNRHPFAVYRSYGVPMTISTDDQGVSRGDLTHEYQRAVETYDLSYDELVHLSRNALHFAFIQGASLWADPLLSQVVAACADAQPGHQEPSRNCLVFLAHNDKARLQWRLEEQFRRFSDDRAALRRQRGFPLP